MDQFNRPPPTYAPISGYSNNMYSQQPMMTPNYNNVYIAPTPQPPMMMISPQPPPIISSQPFIVPPPMDYSIPYVSPQPFMGVPPPLPPMGYQTPISPGYGVTPNLNIPFNPSNYY